MCMCVCLCEIENSVFENLLITGSRKMLRQYVVRFNSIFNEMSLSGSRCSQPHAMLIGLTPLTN